MADNDDLPECRKILKKLDEKADKLSTMSIYLGPESPITPMEYYESIDALTDLQQAYEAAVIFGCLKQELK